MKKILAATALAGFLAAGPAFAQDATTPAQTPAATTDTTTPVAPVERFITLQAPDDWMASKLIGSTVYGPANEDLGDVNDVVIASNGAVKAIVIGVGGFLGIGEKSVAITPGALERVADGKTVKYRLTTTKEELTAAPEFKPLEDVDGTTTSSTSMPADPAADPMTTDTPAPAPAAPAQ